VSLKGTSWSKLTELVTNHVFSYENWNMLATIVHSDSVSDHGRNEHGATRPGLDNNLGVLRILIVNLLE